MVPKLILADPCGLVTNWHFFSYVLTYYGACIERDVNSTSYYIIVFDPYVRLKSSSYKAIMTDDGTNQSLNTSTKSFQIIWVIGAISNYSAFSSSIKVANTTLLFSRRIIISKIFPLFSSQCSATIRSLALLNFVGLKFWDIFKCWSTYEPNSDLHPVVADFSIDANLSTTYEINYTTPCKSLGWSSSLVLSVLSPY